MEDREYYNQQPYEKDHRDSLVGDNDWVRKDIMPIISPYFKGGSVADIGCGNGRLAPMLEPYFKYYYGFDPVEKQHPDYLKRANGELNNFHDHEFTTISPLDFQFDCIIFLGSLYVISLRLEQEIGREKANKMLQFFIDLLCRPGGICIAMEDYNKCRLPECKTRYDFLNNFPLILSKDTENQYLTIRIYQIHPSRNS
jgi:SAM-dependent methyltransferase